MSRVMYKDPTDPTNEELSAWLLKEIPESEVNRVFEADCDLCCEFVGFVKTYWHLSKIIPKDYEVFDFGAAYNFQSWFFKEHKRYNAIEPSLDINMINPDNCCIYRCDTKEFLKRRIFFSDQSFAIVNYVPNWYNQDPMELVKSRFRNVFTFYPSLDYEQNKKILPQSKRARAFAERDELES